MSAVRKVKLADVLWEAANKWLHPTSHNSWFTEGCEGCSYSCHAISAAMRGVPPHTGYEAERDLGLAVLGFVEAMGCDGSPRWVDEHFKAGRTEASVQGVRYMWLLLAMHVAEDEGIEIEVPA